MICVDMTARRRHVRRCLPADVDRMKAAADISSAWRAL